MAKVTTSASSKSTSSETIASKTIETIAKIESITKSFNTIPDTIKGLTEFLESVKEDMTLGAKQLSNRMQEDQVKLQQEYDNKMMQLQQLLDEEKQKLEEFSKSINRQMEEEKYQNQQNITRNKLDAAKTIASANNMSLVDTKEYTQLKSFVSKSEELVTDEINKAVKLAVSASETKLNNEFNMVKQQLDNNNLQLKMRVESQQALIDNYAKQIEYLKAELDKANIRSVESLKASSQPITISSATPVK